MKLLFNLCFLAFIVGGSIFALFLFGGMINEGLVWLFGPVITVPETVSLIAFKIFKIGSIVAVISFPTLFTNIIIRMLQEDTETKKDRNWSIFFVCFFFFVFIVVGSWVFILKEQYTYLTFYWLFWGASISIASPGNKYEKMPLFD
jgi:hypothetical protein